MSDTQLTQPDLGEPSDRPGSGLGWKIAAGVSIVAALAAMAVLGSLLFFSDDTKVADDVRACVVEPVARDFSKDAKQGEHVRPADCPPEGAIKQDGLVQKTTSGGFTMQRIKNGRLAGSVKLYVRESDRPYIDIAHAQTHAALGQPIRVYTLEIDGRPSVVYMEDAPLLR